MPQVDPNEVAIEMTLVDPTTMVNEDLDEVVRDEVEMPEDMDPTEDTEELPKKKLREQTKVSYVEEADEDSVQNKIDQILGVEDDEDDYIPENEDEDEEEFHQDTEDFRLFLEE